MESRGWTQEQMLEVGLKEPDDFLKVRETLSRIGVASRKERKLYQSCHILHKQGRYYIVHFKELFALDGKETNLSENDIARRNSIAKLLKDLSKKHFLSNINLNKKNIVKIIKTESKKYEISLHPSCGIDYVIYSPKAFIKCFILPLT